MTGKEQQKRRKNKKKKKRNKEERGYPTPKSIPLNVTFQNLAFKSESTNAQKHRHRAVAIG
jgi:hypothetical protein